MSDKPRDLTLERIKRLTEAVADLMESHAAQGRMTLRILDDIRREMGGVRQELTDVRAALRDVASEQVLLGNRVENAFSKALRANIRLDDMEQVREP